MENTIKYLHEMSELLKDMLEDDKLRESYFHEISTQVKYCYEKAETLSEFYRNIREESLIIFQDQGKLNMHLARTTIPLSKLGISKEQVLQLQKAELERNALEIPQLKPLAK